MIRLINIEYFKLKNSRYFWVLNLLFLTFMIAVPLGGKTLLNYMGNLGETLGGLSLSEIPLFDFVDIWQNLVWVYKSFSILLGFIAIISVTSEFTNTTLRQQVIDGMSRKEFLISKVGMILVLSLIFSVIALIIGLVAGFLWSPVTDTHFILKNIAFIPAYFLHLFAFQLLCLFVALVIKKSGVTIALLIFYVFVIEPIIYGLMRFEYGHELLSEWLPSVAIGNVIRIPFPKYALQETQTYVASGDVMIVIVYIFLLLIGTYSLLAKRDL